MKAAFLETGLGTQCPLVAEFYNCSSPNSGSELPRAFTCHNPPGPQNDTTHSSLRGCSNSPIVTAERLRHRQECAHIQGRPEQASSPELRPTLGSLRGPVTDPTPQGEPSASGTLFLQCDGAASWGSRSPRERWEHWGSRPHPHGPKA